MKMLIHSRLKYVLLYVLFVLFILFIHAPFSTSNMDLSSEQYDYITNDDTLNKTIHANKDDTFNMRMNGLSTEELNHIDFAIKTYNDNITVSNFPFDIKMTVNKEETPVVYTVNDTDKKNNYVSLVNYIWLRITPSDSVKETLENGCDEIIITFTCKSSDPAFELIQSTSLDTRNKLSINEHPVNETLLIRGVYNGSNTLHLILWIVLLVFGLLFCIFQNGTTLRSYLIIAFLFGILLIIVTPFPNEMEGNELVNVYYYTNHSLLEAPGENVWLPSKLLSKVSYNTLFSSSLSSDYAQYKGAFCAGIPLFQWLLSLPLKLAMSWSLSNVYTLMVLRAFGFLICLVMNAVAVGISGKNKHVIFFVSLIPFILFMTTSIASVGLLFSFSNLLLALAFRHYEDGLNHGAYSMSRQSMALICFLLLIISAQNIAFGMIAMIVLFYIPQRAFKDFSKPVFLWSAAAVYCLTVAANVVYFIHNKDYFNLFVSPISSMIQSTGNAPMAGIILLAENTAAIVNDVINKYVFGNELSVLFAMIMGACIFCITYAFHANKEHIVSLSDRIRESVNNNIPVIIEETEEKDEKCVGTVIEQESESDPDNATEKPCIHGYGLVLFSAVIAGVYAVLCSCIKNSALYSLGGLFGLFLAVALSWMGCRRSAGANAYMGRLLAFSLMICSFIAVSSNM